MKLPAKLEKTIDIAGMLVALVVDLALNLICFLMLAPDVLTAVAFAMIGVMIVLFVFRSWSKGQKFAWLIFVAVVFFFDYSFALEATRAQTSAVTQTLDLNAVYAKDPELVRLATKQQETSTALADLQLQYKAANRRDTLDELDEQIKSKQGDARYYEDKYQERMAVVEKEARRKASHVKLSADDIFSAIPRAYKEGRYTYLIVYGLIFFGLQLIVVTSIDPLHRGKKNAIAELMEAITRAIKKASKPVAPPQLAPVKKPATTVSKKTLAAMDTAVGRLAEAPLIEALKPELVAPATPESVTIVAPPQGFQQLDKASAQETPPAPVKEVKERMLPKKGISDEQVRASILTPVRDNELKAPDAIAYETGISIDVINRFFAALAAAKGPAGRELLYQRDGKWYLGYTKDMVLASVERTADMFKDVRSR